METTTATPDTAAETAAPLDTPKLDLEIFAAERSGTGGNGGGELDLTAAIPVFHGWIQRSELDELWIDVADYRHVPGGPGVLLVAHDAQVALRRGEEGLSLLYSRRRETRPRLLGLAGPGERLRSVFRATLEACRLLEREEAFGGRLRFPGDRLRLRVNDRLAGPNTEATETAVRPVLEELLAGLYPGASFRFARDPEPRARFSLAVEVSEAPGVEALLGRL
jgi:hypothetical protein